LSKRWLDSPFVSPVAIRLQEEREGLDAIIERRMNKLQCRLSRKETKAGVLSIEISSNDLLA
jgi:hypothetical protein